MLIKEEKKCYRCKETKSLSNFHKDKNKKDGLQGNCKACCGKYSKKYVQNHKEETSSYKRKYYREHEEDIVAYQKKYSKDNQESVQKYRKEYHKSIHGYLVARWNTMNQRCNRTKAANYDRYGGAGIKNCFTFSDFFEFVTVTCGFKTVNSLKGMELHRKDNDKHYEPCNVEILTSEIHGSRHRELNARIVRLCPTKVGSLEPSKD